MSEQSIMKELSRVRALKNQSILEKEIWKRIAINSSKYKIPFPKEFGDEVAVEIEQYSGGSYDRLLLSSKFATAIAWSMHPTKEFVDLLCDLEKIDKGMEESAATPDFLILTRGDTYTASGFKVQEWLEFDSEEWYQEYNHEYIFRMKQTEKWEFLQEAIDEFGSKCLLSVEKEMEEKWGLSPEEIVLLLKEIDI